MQCLNPFTEWHVKYPHKLGKHYVGDISTINYELENGEIANFIQWLKRMPKDIKQLYVGFNNEENPNDIGIWSDRVCPNPKCGKHIGQTMWIRIQCKEPERFTPSRQYILKTLSSKGFQYAVVNEDWQSKTFSCEQCCLDDGNGMWIEQDFQYTSILERVKLGWLGNLFRS
jgi:hypothetical protein